MKFVNYHIEKPRQDLEQILSKYNNYDHKIDVWNTFADANMLGLNDDDFSIFPRVLPSSYWPTLRQRVYLITKFALRLLSLPEHEIRAILPKGPIRDHLLDELEVVRFRHKHIVGSFRYDMAIVGPPDRHHPPC